MRGVFLVGFMGAGKSSVGLALSKLLGWPFEDLDERIQAREKRTIKQIFESGETAFRRAEHTALRDLLAQPAGAPRIVALGGGTMAQADNAALLEAADAALVFLHAPVEELYRRCQQEKVERPLRKDVEQFRGLYEARQAHYQKASVRIETAGKSVDAVAAEIAQTLGLS
jgi:shikimate kinase